MSVDVSGLVATITGRFAIDAAERLGTEFMWAARSNAPRDSGNLADSIQMEAPRISGDRVTVSVFTPEAYAVYQNRGTGVYAGEGRIYPRRARALSFFWKEAGGMVAFASVAGTPPTHFWDRTVLAWSAIVAAAA